MDRKALGMRFVSRRRGFGSVAWLSSLSGLRVRAQPFYGSCLNLSVLELTRCGVLGCFAVEFSKTLHRDPTFLWGGHHVLGALAQTQTTGSRKPLNQPLKPPINLMIAKY